MITTAQAVDQILSRSPFLKEALHDGIINVSSLARKIQPEVEEIIMKKVKHGAIIMSINRLHVDKNFRYQNKIRNYILKVGDFNVKTDLSLYTYAMTKSLSHLQVKFFSAIETIPDAFCSFSQGISERTLIVNREVAPILEDIFKDEILISKGVDLASITIKLSDDSLEIPGMYYYILKQLAWEDICLEEVLSTRHEFTLIMKEEYIQQSLHQLMKMKKR